jgi:hypothetical protein
VDSFVNKRKMMNSEEEYEEIILRRVFGLCFLNTVDCATYRQVLNPRRLSDISNAQDYTVVDYNYVTIKRKQMSDILHAIASQPGPSIDTSLITQVLQKWATLTYETPLEAYHLDKAQRRLVKEPGCATETSRFLVAVDHCPRSGQLRASFYIAFFKKRLPDLMGDTSVENLDLLTKTPYCPLCELQRVTEEATK